MKDYKLPENIRFYRQTDGMTQEQLAAYFNSHKSLVSNYENGNSTPDIFTIWKLADIFGISIDELTGHEPKKAENKNTAE